MKIIRNAKIRTVVQMENVFAYLVNVTKTTAVLLKYAVVKTQDAKIKIVAKMEIALVMYANAQKEEAVVLVTIVKATL